MATKNTPTDTDTAPEPEKPAGEALMSSADLMRATGYGHAAISELAATGAIKQAKRGLWPIVETMGAMIRKLRERAEGFEDRARKNKAEADSAESDAMDKAKSTCPIDYAVLYVSETRIAIRQMIEREPILSEAQKKKLLMKLAEIKIDPPKAES